MAVDYRKQYTPEQLEPFFPHEIVKMAIVVLTTLAVVMFVVILPTLLEMAGWSGVFHEEQPADPRTTPAHIRPEWYFLAVYQYLKLMPQELLGIDGKALGILTQAVGAGMVLLLPFWYPDRPARIDSRDWRRGLAVFFAMLSVFLAGAVGLTIAAWGLRESIRGLLHPMFVWPPLAVFAFLCAGFYARKRGLSDAFEWLHVFGMGLLLIAAQFVAFVVVLGQGLSWAAGAVAGYGLGGVLFVAASLLIVRLVVERVRGRDRKLRRIALVTFVTEAVVLFVGLTVWAMWPAGGLVTEEGWHEEVASFTFFVLMISVVLVVFYSLIATERRTIRRTLGTADAEEENP